jgi:Rad3-related DNA helicase
MAVVRINIPSKATLPDKWDDIRDDFPMPSPRKYQAEALSVAYWAMENDDFDNIVIQAPTGIGKSALAMTVQNQFQSAYLLTPSLGLIDQYKADYGHKLSEVRGRSNFDCWVRNGTAKGAPCWSKAGSCKHAKRKEDGGDPCGYYEQRFEAEDARLTLSNPAYLFRAVQGYTNFNQREFAIIDEAHDLEGFIHDLLEVRLSAKEWQAVFGKERFPNHLTPRDWRQEMKERIEVARESLKKAEADLNMGTTEKEVERIREAVSKMETAVEILHKPSNVHISYENNKWGHYLILKPIRVRQYAAEIIEAVSKKRIMLSATILDIETFLHGLGLEGQKTLYINITESPFPSQNFNVHYAPCGSMSWGKRKHTIPRQVKAIDAIMRQFPHKRGVILPHSHAIRKEIVQGLKDAGHEDRILTHDGNPRARKEVLDEFFTSDRDDLVLISTYVTQGFDFKGKLAEWLCILKVPYLPTKDPVIAERMMQDEQAWRAVHEDTPSCPYEPPSKYSGELCGAGFTCDAPCQKWYQLQTALAIVQGAGRVVRTPEDVGHLFILDGGWQRFARNSAHLIPSWFRNNIKDAPPWLKRQL